MCYIDIENYNRSLAEVIGLEYYRIATHLNEAVSIFVKRVNELREDKECYLSIINYPNRYKIRELKTLQIGTLVRITGQVIRTHPVHPELISGAFICEDCQTSVSNVEQQFKVFFCFKIFNQKFFLKKMQF